MNCRLTGPTWETTATECFSSPDASAGSRTLPGNASNATFDVNGTTTAVAIVDASSQSS